MTSLIKKNDKYECPVCNVEIGDMKTWEKHSAGKKHQQNLHHAELNRKREENGLFIRGFPPMTTSDSIRGFLRRFGEFSDFYYNEPRNFVLATFSEKKAAEELLNYPLGIFFNQRRLKISRRRPPPAPIPVNKGNAGNKSPSKDEPTLPRVNLDRVLGALRPTGSLDELLRQLEASPDEKAKYACVITALKFLFELRFRRVNVHTFGSTRTGLNLKGSDVDVFVEILEGEDPSSDQSLPSPEKLVRIGQKLMFQNQNIFRNVLAITRAKTPIVKFVHRPTLISCDVSFKNMLAVANSHLICFYTSVDPRVYPYFMIIKYWAKIHEFSGCGRMSNYALVTIAAFYLQQLDPPVLPTVHELQKNCPEKRVDGWKCHFSENKQAIDSTKNTMTIMELLYGFFKYFRDFNIIGQVVCSLTGTIVPKVSFVNHDLLPLEIREEYIQGVEARKHGLRVCANMAVQDPFELTHNLTASMGTKALKAFSAHCSLAAGIFEEALKVQGPDENKLEFLKVLFTKKPKVVSQAKSVPFSMTKTEMQMIYMAGETISVSYLIPNVNDPHLGKDASEEDVFSHWVQLVYRLLLQFFNKIMKFEVVEKAPEPTALKVQKVDSPSDVHAPVPASDVCTANRRFLQCKGCYCLWDNRRRVQAELKLPNNLDFLKVEEMVTDVMYKALLQGKSPSPAATVLDFSCEFIPVKEPSVGIKFIFKDTGCQKKRFSSIMMYMRTKLPFVFTKYMKFMKSQFSTKATSANKTPDAGASTA